MNIRLAYKGGFKGVTPAKRYKVYEVLPFDLPTSLGAEKWGCDGVAVGALETEFGKGNINTDLIVDTCSPALFAARLCALYIYGGKQDWYLPNTGEMQKIYECKDFLGGFSLRYWTSTENSTIDGADPDNAKTFHMGTGTIGTHAKTQVMPFNIRPMRQYYTNSTKFAQVGKQGEAGGIVIQVDTLDSKLHEVEIYDTLTEQDQVDPIELQLISPGYQIKYDNSISDIIKAGIISSELQFAVTNINNYLHDFLTDLTTSKDARFVVQVKQDEELVWRGVLLNDFSNVEDNEYHGISFEAVDGLALLKDKYPTDQPREAINIGMLGWILDGLREIPTSLFWDLEEAPEKLITDKFAYVKTAYETPTFTPLYFDSLTSDVAINPNAPTNIWGLRKRVEGYNGDIYVEKTYRSFFDIIEHILRHFNCVLVMRNGAWYITQRKILSEAGTIAWYIFKKQNELNSVGGWAATPYTENETFTLTEIDYNTIYRSKGQFMYLPPLKQVKVTFNAGNVLEGADSLIPAGFRVGQNYTTFPLPQGTGNYIHLSLNFSEEFANPEDTTDPDATPWRATVLYKVKVKNGTYYLAYTGAWTETETYLWVTGTMLEFQPPAWAGSELNDNEPDVGIQNFRTFVERDWMSDDLPVDGQPVEVEIVERQVNLIFGDVDTPEVIEVEFDWDAENHFLAFIHNNENPVTAATFVATADGDNTIEHELGSSLFGSVGYAIQGNNVIRPAGLSWRSGEDTVSRYFNDLLVHEVLRLQLKFLLVFSGIVTEKQFQRTDPFRTYVLNYKYANYTMFGNRVQYTAQSEEYEGDWIEINYDKTTSVPTKPPTIEDAPLVPMPLPGAPRPTPYPIPKPIIDQVEIAYRKGRNIKNHNPKGLTFFIDPDDGQLKSKNNKAEINIYRAAAGVVLNGNTFAGIRYEIQASDKLVIPELFQYNVLEQFTIDGEVDCDGEINIT